MEKQYAFIKDSNVINVVVFDNPTENLLEIFKNENSLDLIIEANHNSATGGTYDGTYFWMQQPYPSWTKNYDLNIWQPPVPYPQIEENSNEVYDWDEESLSWILINS
jgi:hypothetical protein